MTPGLQVLIVDDDQEILDVVSMLLQRQGCKVSARVRMGDFLAEVRAVSPDLIIIDQHLGWADGCDLCAMLKEDSGLQHIPVLMFSAYHKMQENCLSSGAYAFLAKPFEMRMLLEMIQSLTICGTPQQFEDIN